MRRRSFLQCLSLVFLPLVRTPPARPVQVAGDPTFRDSVSSDGAMLRAVLSDHNPQTGVGYAGN